MQQQQQRRRQSWNVGGTSPRVTVSPRGEPSATGGVVRSVRRLCDAKLDSRTLRREVAARLAPAIGFDAYAFCTCDPDAGLISDVVAHGLSHTLGSAYVERVLPELWDERATHASGAARVTVATVPSRGDVAAENDARPSEACASDEYLHVPLTTRGRLWGTLWLVRRRGTQRASDRACALLSRLVPHLVRGLQAASRFGAEPTPTEVTRDAEPGVLVLDGRSRAVMRTPAASPWLEDLADLGLRMPDDLPLAVLALAARARAAGPGGVRREARVRARGRSGRWYLLRGSLTEPCGGERATVVIVRPAAAPEVATSLIRLHALSAREHEIVAAVARGESTKEIAAALGRSPHTVCEHIGRACQKLGVRGRKALVAKLFVGAAAAAAASVGSTEQADVVSRPPLGYGADAGRRATVTLSPTVTRIRSSPISRRPA